GVGPVLLTGAGIGLLCLKRQPSFLKNIIVLIFLLVTLVLTSKAGRFTVFTLLPLSLLFAGAVHMMAQWLNPRPYGKIIIGILLAAILGWGWHDGNQNIRTVLTPIY